MFSFGNAHMFIVPNQASKIQNVSESHAAGISNERMNELNLPHFFHLRDNDIAVHVWVCDDDPHSNWNDHGIPEELLQDKEERKFFPTLLPYRVLEGLKEGANVKISINGKDVFVTCSQLTHRYARFGTFHEVLQKITRVARAKCIVEA